MAVVFPPVQYHDGLDIAVRARCNGMPSLWLTACKVLGLKAHLEQLATSIVQRSDPAMWAQPAGKPWRAWPVSHALALEPPSHPSRPSRPSRLGKAKSESLAGTAVYPKWRQVSSVALGIAFRARCRAKYASRNLSPLPTPADSWALVTGAATGLGQKLATACAEAGFEAFGMLDIWGVGSAATSELSLQRNPAVSP